MTNFFYPEYWKYDNTIFSSWAVARSRPLFSITESKKKQHIKDGTNRKD